jgi:hypothetical protein
VSWQATPTKAPVKLGRPGAVASSDRMLASKVSGSQRQSLPSELQANRRRSKSTSTRSWIETRRQRHGIREGVGLGRVRQGRHHAQMTTVGLVMGDVQIVELCPPVVADQPRRLLEVLGLEVHQGRRRVAEGLLPASDQGLAILAAHTLATMRRRSQPGRFGQAEQLLRPGRPQPLEVDRQLRAVEVGPDLRVFAKRMRRQVRRGERSGSAGPCRRRCAASRRRPRPSVGSPSRGPITQRARLGRGRPQR